MKIGIDIRLWDETGIGRYIRNLVNELAKIDKRNTYYLFSKNEFEMVEKKFPSNFKTVRTNIHWHTINEQMNFAKEIEKYDLDLMHFPYFSVPINYKKP